MYDIITIGSATVDVFVNTRADGREILKHAKHVDVCLPLGAKILIDDLHVETGGGGTNSAVAFSRLGFKTGWIGTVGKDLNGVSVIDQMKKEKVTFLGHSVSGRTGYSVILAGLRHDRTVLAFKGVNDKLKPVILPQTKWVYCSAMLGQSWNSLVKMVEQARRKNVRVAFNPSLYLAKKGLRSLAPMLKHLDVLVLNKEEAQALLKQNVPINKLLKLLSHHVRIAVITDGKNGAVATEGYFAHTIKTRPIKVVETTGAGDAFAAGFVAGQMLGWSIQESLKLGQVEAEGVLSAVGAKNNLRYKKEISKLIKKQKVKVTAL